MIEAKSYTGLTTINMPNQNLSKELALGLNNLSAADEGHLGCHHRHELNVGIQWQSSHVD